MGGDRSGRDSIPDDASRDIADEALARVRARLGWRARSEHARRWIILGVVLTICAASAALTAIVVAALLARESPVWWRTVDPNDSEVVELAERVERAVVSAMHRARPDAEPWTVAVTASQANAWLNVKLPQWARSRDAGWPREIAEVQTHFADGRIGMGMRLAGGRVGNAPIVAATVEPTMREGALWLAQPATVAGRLDLPAGWTINRLSSWLPPEMRTRSMTRRTLDALMQKGPVIPDASFRIEDGRRVRLVAITVEQERLLLTFETDLPSR